MDNEIQKMLEDTIKEGISKISHMSEGSVEKKEAIENLEILHNMLFEHIRVEAEKVKDKKERKNKVIIAGGDALIKMTFYAFWMYCGFKFEETGTFTSKTFMNLINRFRV